MSNYPGRTKGTRRIVVWHRGVVKEKVIQGTKRDADQYEARWRIQLQGGEQVDARKIPAFSDFCAVRYRPHAEKHLKHSTWSLVRVYQIDTLCKHLGHLNLVEVSRVETIEAYKTARSAELVFRHGVKRPVMPSSINNELRVLRTILNWARELGYQIPVQRWKKLPIRGKSRAKAWSESEVQSLFAAARIRYPEFVPLFVFLMNTGCRKGEAIVAEHSWLDWTARLIRIPSTEAWQPKNGLPREVPISDALQAALSGRKTHEKYLFPSRIGGRYACFPKDLFDEVRTLAGVTGGPHTFRHTFASHFLKNRPDMRLLGEVMGHSHARVTQLYSHMLPDHLRKARNAVNIGPKLQTVAATMADRDRTANLPIKTYKRH